MRKYYYYTYLKDDSIGANICFSEEGHFPFINCWNFTGERVILFWHEITSDEYEYLFNKDSE